MRHLQTRAVLAIAAVLVLAGCGTPRPTTYVATPVLDQAPQGRALVVFHAPAWGVPDTWLWDSTRLIGLVWGPGVYTIDCEPGVHHFLAHSRSDSVVTADLKAGQVYDIMVDMVVGGGYYGPTESAKLVPLTRDEPRRAQVADFLKRTLGKHIAWDVTRQAETDAWAQGQQPRIQKILDKFLIGKLQDRVLKMGPDDHR